MHPQMLNTRRMVPHMRVAAFLRSVLTEPISSADPAAPAALAIPPRDSAERDPLALDSVYRAVSVIATAISQLSIDVTRAGQVLNPAPSITRNPCSSLPSRSAFLTMTAQHMALRGECFWLTRCDRDGAVIDIDILNPLHVGITTSDYTSTRGQVRYHWDGRDYTPGQIIHLALLRGARPDGHGAGPIQAGMSTVTGALRLRHYADTFLDAGKIPPGILTTDAPITTEQADRLKERLVQALEGGYGGEPIIMGHGAKYEPVLLKPEEVQWLEAQKAGALAIARMFGVPSRQMLVAPDGSSMTYANAEQEDTAFIRYTLMAYLREIEEAMTALLPRGNEARFNIDALRRTDTKTRYDGYRTALESGFLTLNEVRAIENLPALPESKEPNSE